MIAVDVVEDVACGLHRQRGDFRASAAWRDCFDTGSDTEADCFELAEFFHHRIDLLGVCSFWVKNRLGVVEDKEDLLGGKEGSERCEVLGVFHPCTDNLGQSGKELGARGLESIAADESTVPAESFFDPIVVEDFESNGCLPDPPCTDESDRLEVFSESDHLLNQLVASETAPRGRGRQFPKRDSMNE